MFCGLVNSELSFFCTASTWPCWQRTEPSTQSSGSLSQSCCLSLLPAGYAPTLRSRTHPAGKGTGEKRNEVKLTEVHLMKRQKGWGWFFNELVNKCHRPHVDMGSLHIFPSVPLRTANLESLKTAWRRQRTSVMTAALHCFNSFQIPSWISWRDLKQTCF